MRAALYAGALALVLGHLASRYEPVEPDRAIPRFILHKGAWVCVDRNPREISRLDCRPRLPSPHN
jgi:hypothetical protein